MLIRLVLFCVVALSCLLCEASAPDTKKFMLFSKTKKAFKARKFELARILDENYLYSNYGNTQHVKVKEFSWSSCAGPDALLTLRKLQLSDPVIMPGNLTVSVDAELSGDALSPLKVAVKVQKKLGFIWIEVPCVENVGSCNYDDFCSVVPFKPDEPCPDFFVHTGLPCHCPAMKGKYAVENGVLPIPKDPLPEFLARGQYAVRVSVSSRGQEVTCLKFSVALA